MEGISLAFATMESSQPSAKQPRGIVGTMPLLVFIATLIADQASKELVRLALQPGQSVPASGLFRFTYVTNTGSAFGLFPNQTTALIVASFVGIGALLVFYRTHRTRGILLPISLGLQLGGATGNLVDRIRMGYVVDFIDVGWWPVFNLADSAIVVGLTALLWIILTTQEKATPKHEVAEDNALAPTIPEEESVQGADLDSTPALTDTPSERNESPWQRSGE